MAKKKVNTAKVLTGLGMTVAGGLMATLLDEALVTAGTGGLGAVAAPVQAPVTAGIGSLIATAGLGLIADGLSGD